MLIGLDSSLPSFRVNSSHTYFLHMEMNDCADTNPVFSPPAALNMGAFQ